MNQKQFGVKISIINYIDHVYNNYYTSSRVVVPPSDSDTLTLQYTFWCAVSAVNSTGSGLPVSTYLFTTTVLGMTFSEKEYSAWNPSLSSCTAKELFSIVPYIGLSNPSRAFCNNNSN